MHVNVAVGYLEIVAAAGEQRPVPCKLSPPALVACLVHGLQIPVRVEFRFLSWRTVPETSETEFVESGHRSLSIVLRLELRRWDVGSSGHELNDVGVDRA